MALYGALYVRKCQSSMCWFEPGEQSLLGLDLVKQTMELVKRIRDSILTACSKQKSYADVRRRPLEFQEKEHAFLKITPTISIESAMKVKKLIPHFLGPF